MIKRILIIFISLALGSCAVNYYGWMHSIRSIPSQNDSSFKYSFNVVEVIDQRPSFTFGNKIERFLPEAINREFKQELSRHFVLKDSLSADILIKLEIKDFSFWNKKAQNKSTLKGYLSSAVLSSAVMIGADIYDEYDEYAKAELVAYSALGLWIVDLFFRQMKQSKGFFLDSHNIVLSATLSDNNNKFIKTYIGSASGNYKFDKNKGETRLKYIDEMNESLSSALNQIIEDIYEDKEYIKNHFKS